MYKQIGSSLSAATLVIVSGIVGTQAFAKDTLIDMDNARVGGFGGPVFKTSQIDNKQTFELGGSGGATFTTGKHSVMLGGAGYGLVNELEWNNNQTLEMGYGGFLIGYTYNPEALIHVDTQLLLGIGGVSTINDDNSSDSSTFLISEVSTQVEINITDFMEIGVGASYRLATDPDLDTVNDHDLSSPGVFITFQFGSL